MRPSGPSRRSAETACATSCPGDRVLVSCISACGSCRFCREARYGQCLEGGGWVLGHKIDGTQAEYVRVPYADLSTFRIPDGVSDEEVLMLADILPTGYEVGVLAGGVRPGDVVAVVGAGPVGLSAITSTGCSAPATSWPSTCPTPGSMRPSSSAPTSPSTTRAKTRSASSRT